MDEKEYIVTVKEGVDWREVHEDLTKENQKQFIPNHKVPVDDLREINKRNTHYHLSDQEAAELRKDSRIEAVQIPMVPQKKALQEGNSIEQVAIQVNKTCLLYTSPSPRDIS